MQKGVSQEEQKIEKRKILKKEGLTSECSKDGDGFPLTCGLGDRFPESWGGGGGRSEARRQI